jgi:hypothetical protein
VDGIVEEVGDREDQSSLRVVHAGHRELMITSPRRVG